jgi:hypothetical protein
MRLSSGRREAQVVIERYTRRLLRFIVDPGKIGCAFGVIR